MIKRVIACLTICLIITGIISPVFSHAEPVPIYTPNWSDPGIAEIIDISDLTGWMANGGVFDITDFQDLEEFLGWYFKLRVPIKDEDGNVTFSPYYGYEKSMSSGNESGLKFSEQSQIRGMIARSYQNKTGYGRRLQEQVDKALLEDGDLSNVYIPLLNQAEAAFFVGYNPNAINFYQAIFDLGASNISPDVPAEYYDLIDQICSYRVGSIDLTSLPFYTQNYMPTTIDYDLFDYSLAHNGRSNPFIDYSTGGLTFGSDIITANITTNQNDISLYDVSFTGLNAQYIFRCPVSGNYTHRPCTDKCQLIDYQGTTYWNLSGSASSTFTPSLNGGNTGRTLTALLNDINNNFRHINIYVDGVLWGSASSSSSSNSNIPEFPDVVGGEELPITTWPLTVPKAPSYINLPGLRQAFQRAKNTDNQFDIMDLKDSLVDPEGDPIVDPEMETVPIPLPNPDPINPEVVPELPDLPLIPPANNPGFSGVSVLAEIINFTNQSLPSALITVFWGIVFGAVILGIIKILHK